MKQKKVRVPYSNYGLPPSAEQGGQFVDFNQAYREAPTKVPKRKVKIKRKKKWDIENVQDASNI